MKNTKIVLIGSLLATLLVIANACYYDAVIPVEPSVGDLGEVTFAADIIPVFNASCNVSSCHNTGGVPPDLSPANAYSQLNSMNLINTANPKASELYQWMTGNKSLPMPVSGTNHEYNALVLAWIQQGALDN